LSLQMGVSPGNYARQDVALIGFSLEHVSFIRVEDKASLHTPRFQILIEPVAWIYMGANQPERAAKPWHPGSKRSQESA
jgi:hypothetical protein